MEWSVLTLDFYVVEFIIYMTVMEQEDDNPHRMCDLFNIIHSVHPFTDGEALLKVLVASTWCNPDAHLVKSILKLRLIEWNLRRVQDFTQILCIKGLRELCPLLRDVFDFTPESDAASKAMHAKDYYMILYLYEVHNMYDFQPMSWGRIRNVPKIRAYLMKHVKPEHRAEVEAVHRKFCNVTYDAMIKLDEFACSSWEEKYNPPAMRRFFELEGEVKEEIKEYEFQSACLGSFSSEGNEL